MTEPTIRTVVLEDVIQSSTGAAASNGADDAPAPLVRSPGIARSSEVLWPMRLCLDETEAGRKMWRTGRGDGRQADRTRVHLEQRADAAGAGVLRPARDDRPAEALSPQPRGA